MSENTQNQCAGCNVPAGGVYQISEPSRIKPSMSMHVSVEDYKRDLAKWEAENKEPRHYWSRLCKLPAYSFMLANGGVKRVEDSCGNWLERAEVQAIVDDAQGRITEIESQLESIGAGGVESLRQSNQHAITTAAARAGTVYVSGPMTGYADLNFPAFNAEAAKLREQGLKVTNPADHGEVPGAQWADYLRTDVAQLAACERIHLLPGWSKSKGAQLELHLAKALEMQITLAEGAEPLELAAVQQGVQPEVDLPDVEDMAHSALEECLSGGLSHFVLHKWMRSVMTRTQKALATHPTQQVVPDGFVLMPKRVTADMQQVMDTDGWLWEDLLAAACAITEKEYAELSTHPTQQGLDVIKEARNTGINHGVCLALQIMTAAGDAGGAQWNELVDVAGREEMEHYAKVVEPEEWELAGFAHVERFHAEMDAIGNDAAQAKLGEQA